MRPDFERGGAAALPCPHGFEVVRFELLSSAQSLLGLSLHTPYELPARARPALLVEREAVELIYSPRLTSSRPPLVEQGRWLWRGIFAVPPELACDPEALFALRLSGEHMFSLPAPVPALSMQNGGDRGERRGWPYVVRRGALLFIVISQLWLVPTLASPGALAAGGVASGATAQVASEAGLPSSPVEGEKPVQPALEKPPQATPEKSQEPPRATPETAQPPQAGGGQAQAPTPTQPPAGGTNTTGQDPSGKDVVSVSVSEAADSASGSSDASGRVHRRAVPTTAKTGAGPTSGAGRGQNSHHHSHGDRPPARPGSSAPSSAQERAAVAPGLEAEVPPVLLRLPPGLETLGEDAPPPYLVPFYVAAGDRYGVPWQILAAINSIETDYGRNLSVSSAGAEGWMQFMPATWSTWGVDADHDGVKNPYSPLDAIFAAARYLKASGAAHDLPGAIFAYNHAQWYVSEVLLRARMLAGDLTANGSEKGYALPLDEPYMQPLGRTDDGVDIENAPDGALVYSITPGTVSAVASDPGGFGPNYPVIEAGGGSLAGQCIYYGHVAQALVHPGQRVKAGEPIAVMGHTGDATSLARGHIEIGFSDAAGDPLDHHGAEAWTPAGAVMRSFLVTLSSGFSARGARAHASRAHHEPAARLARHRLIGT